DLAVSSPPKLTNDAFASAAYLQGVNDAAWATSVNATKEAGEPSHAGNAGGKSVWWSWIAPEDGTVTISTAGSSFNTLLGVYTGASVGSLTTIASNNNQSNGVNTSLVTFNVVGGQTYHIAVDGFNGVAGSIKLALNETVGNKPDLTAYAPYGW